MELDMFKANSPFKYLNENESVALIFADNTQYQIAKRSKENRYATLTTGLILLFLMQMENLLRATEICLKMKQ